MIRKLIWAEGILLGQQHFQQWDQYWEQQLLQRIKTIAPRAWGLERLQIDEDALLNGVFRITQISAIFPQGQWVKYDATQMQWPLNYQLNLQNDTTVSLYLCLPANQQTAGIAGYVNTPLHPRWIAEYQAVHDLFDAEREKEVLFGRFNLNLLAEQDSRENYYYFKIAEVINRGRHYEWIKTFIPTVVSIQASPFLWTYVGKWRELILAKIRWVKEILQPDNFKCFVLLKTLHTAFVRLEFLRSHGDMHPQDLFQLMSDILAELCVFTEEKLLTELPSYQHENLTATFAAVDQCLQESLSTIMPIQTHEVKLQRVNDTLYCAENIPEMIFSNTQFFVAIYCALEDPQWIIQFVRQVKVCSARTMDSIITSALSGVKLIHMQRPPNKLSIKAGYEYFYLEPSGEFWQQIKTQGSLAIFIPENFVNAKIELVTMEEKNPP